MKTDGEASIFGTIETKPVYEFETPKLNVGDTIAISLAKRFGISEERIKISMPQDGNSRYFVAGIANKRYVGTVLYNFGTDTVTILFDNETNREHAFYTPDKRLVDQKMLQRQGNIMFKYLGSAELMGLEKEFQGYISPKERKITWDDDVPRNPQDRPLV